MRTGRILATIIDSAGPINIDCCSRDLACASVTRVHLPARPTVGKDASTIIRGVAERTADWHATALGYGISPDADTAMSQTFEGANREQALSRQPAEGKARVAPVTQGLHSRDGVRSVFPATPGSGQWAVGKLTLRRRHPSVAIATPISHGITNLGVKPDASHRRRRSPRRPDHPE